MYLFHPWALVTLYDIPGIQWAYSIPGPWSPSLYDMPGIQWAYSIPGPWSPSLYDMPGIQWTYSIPGPWSPCTTYLGYSGPIPSLGLGHIVRHTWDTVDLFHPWALVTLYDIPGIQWTYPEGPKNPSLGLGHLVRHAWETVGLFYPWALVTFMTCLGYVGSILSLGLSHLVRHAWDTVDLLYP